jgi:hypothetical protein
MKKIFLNLSIVAAVIAFPVLSFGQKDKDKDGKKEWNDREQIEGSGNIITKDITIQSFNELKVSGVFSVYLEQGNSESVKIEADDNFQPLFEVKNEGSKLVIKMKEHVSFKTKKGSKGMKVYITLKT